MKRAHPCSSSDFAMKEAKMEVEDDPNDFKFATGLEKIIKEEVPDEEDYGSLMMTNPRLEQFLEQNEEEEYPEEEYPWSTVKSEPVEFIKKEAEPEPQSALIWKPNIPDFMSLDAFDDSELDLGLGSSILFDNNFSSRNVEVKQEKKPPKIELINFDEESDPNFREVNDAYYPKKQLPPHKVKKILDARFEENRHPTAIEMVKIAEEAGVRYRTVFENFENRRTAKKVHCEENDPCRRIRSFFLRDGENLSYHRVTEQVRRALEDEIETHLFSRKKFSIGYVHVIMEKTNLPPTYIKGQYESYKKKVLTKDREDYKSTDDSEDPNSLPMEILRKLEEAYLTKKYQCEEKEWSPKDYKALSAQLEIAEKTVTAWIEKRKDATLGLTDDVVELRKAKLEKMRQADGRKLASHITQALEAEFNRNDRPSVPRRVIIAKKLKITEMQVTNFFNKRRIRARRHAEWEDARQDVKKMDREKVRMLEKLAAERRKSAADYMAIAKKIGVKYMTLVSFVNWRKSIMSLKLSDFKYQSSANHKY